MYTRFTRRLYQIFVSSSSRKNPCVSITSSYQRFFEITCNRPTNSLRRNLYSSSTAYREADTATQCKDEMSFNVSYEQLLEAQKDNEVLIVDVREYSEIDMTGKLPGSIHIPMSDVKDALRELSEEEFEERYGKRKPNKDTKIIFSCRSGKRSGMVQDEIRKLGYTKAYNYTGGWLEWESKQNEN